MELDRGGTTARGITIGDDWSIGRHSAVEETRRSYASPEDVFERDYDRLVQALSLIAGSRDAAADAVQEAFVRLINRWDTVGTYEDPAGWVRRVAVNLIRDQQRAFLRQTRLVLKLERDRPAPEGSLQIDEELWDPRRGADADENGGWDSSGSIVVAPSQPQVLYARTSFGLFRSGNGGDDWTELPGVGLPTADAPVGVNDPVVLVAADDPETVFVRASDGIYRSADGGRTFSRVIDPAATLLVDPRHVSRIYAVWPTGEVLFSEDRGATWATSSSHDLSSSVSLANGSLAAVAASSDGRLLFAIDGEGGTILAGGSPSGPTGAPPVPVSLGKPNQLLYDSVSPRTVFAATVEWGGEEDRIGVVRSANDGTTWQDITGGLMDAGSAKLAIDAEGALYVATDRGLFIWEP